MTNLGFNIFGSAPIPSLFLVKKSLRTYSGPFQRGDAAAAGSKRSKVTPSLWGGRSSTARYGPSAASRLPKPLDMKKPRLRALCGVDVILHPTIYIAFEIIIKMA